MPNRVDPVVEEPKRNEIVQSLSSGDISTLKWHLDRLLMAVNVFSQSMTDEFHPSIETTRDWQDNLSLLREASFPLGNFVAKHVRCVPSLKRKWQVLDKILTRASVPFEVTDKELELAHEATVLWRANQDIRRAISWINGWFNEVRDSGTANSSAATVEANWVVRPAKTVVLRVWETHMGRLTNVATMASTALENTFRQCMCSRKAYLVSVYMKTIYPDLWSEPRRERLIKSQEGLLDAMSEGSPYRLTVARRLDTIKCSLVLQVDASVGI